MAVSYLWNQCSVSWQARVTTRPCKTTNREQRLDSGATRKLWSQLCCEAACHISLGGFFLRALISATASSCLINPMINRKLRVTYKINLRSFYLCIAVRRSADAALGNGGWFILNRNWDRRTNLCSRFLVSRWSANCVVGPGSPRAEFRRVNRRDSSQLGRRIDWFSLYFDVESFSRGEWTRALDAALRASWGTRILSSGLVSHVSWTHRGHGFAGEIRIPADHWFCSGSWRWGFFSGS